MTCSSGKRVYRNQDTAERMARALRELGVTGAQWAYRCPECRLWHTTSQPQGRLALAARLSFARRRARARAATPTKGAR